MLYHNLVTDLKGALDPVSWARSELSFNPDPWQTEVLRSQAPRILLNCSRQSGKSTVTSLLALHKAVFRPRSLILLMSPTLRQSGELFKNVLGFYNQMKSPPISETESALKLELNNGSRIISLPGKEQNVRGYAGVTLLIVDEAARVPDELYYSTRPMLAVSNGRLIALSTPWGKRGWFYKSWKECEEAWVRFSIMADQCPRISPQFLMEEKRALGEWWFRQEYMCEFKETEDQLFSRDLIDRMLNTDAQPLFGGTKIKGIEKKELIDWKTKPLSFEDSEKEGSNRLMLED
jgi:hypothetical protein